MMKKQQIYLLGLCLVWLCLLSNGSLSLVLAETNRVSNCSMIYIPSSSSLAQQQHSLLACTSIIVPNETTVNYRYEDNVRFSLFYPFFDSKYVELCNVDYINTLFSKYHVDSCSSLFCNTMPQQVLGESFEQSLNISSIVKSNLVQYYNISSSQKQKQLISDLAHMVNYCQYCNRDDFISFHTTLNNSSKCLTFVSANFCNYNQPPNSFQTITIDSLTNTSIYQLDSTQESKLEIPLLHGTSLLNQDVFLPWQCSCGQFQYAFKCDYFSTMFIPFTFRAYPIICFVVTILLLIVCFFTLIIPTIYRNVKNAKMNMKNNLMPMRKVILDEILSISWLIIVFLVLHLIFSALENLLSFATIGMFQAKSSIGSGFFRAVSLLCLFSALFGIFVMWVNLLLQTNSKNSVGANSITIHKYLKVILTVFLLTFGLLLVLPLIYIGLPSIAKIFNLTFFILTVVFTIFLIVGFSVFGGKLFIQLKKANNLSIFQIKFTRAIMIIFVAAAFVFLQMILIIIEYAASQVLIGLFYRSVNFNTLDLSMLLVTSGLIYLLCPSNEMFKLYCPSKISKIIN